MRSDTFFSVALVALYSSSAVAGPIDFLRRSESSEYVRRGVSDGDLNRRGHADSLSGLGLGEEKGEGDAKPPAVAQPPQEVGMGKTTVVASPPIGTAPAAPLGTGVAPPSGTGVIPPALEASPPPFANGTTAIPPQADVPGTACPPAQTVTITVTETMGGGSAATPPVANPPPVESPPAQSPVGSPPAANPSEKPPVTSTPPVAAKPQPLPTEVLTTAPLAPIDATASAVITNSAIKPAEVDTSLPPQASNPPAAVEINPSIGGSSGNSGTINNIQIIVIQFLKPGATKTITSIVNGLPVTETVTQPPSTVTSTVTMTEGAAATGTGAVLPPGAEVISNVTVPAVPKVQAPPYALGNETAPALATGVFSPSGALGTGILPPPGAIETGAAASSSAGVLPPPGAVESGIPPPPGAVETGTPPAHVAHTTPVASPAAY